MSAGSRGKIAVWVAGLCAVSGYALGGERLVRALWVGESVPSTPRADSVFQAAAFCLLLFIVALVASVIARVRVRKSDASPRTVLFANVWLVASILGLGFVLFLAFAGSVLSIGVG